MNRLALLIACIGATVSSACLAARPAQDPAFCKSMCASEQNTCRAEARTQIKDERFAFNEVAERNPFARTAQEQVRGTNARALDAAGDQNRTSQRIGSCDASYQRCTQACTSPAPTLVPAPASALTPAPARASTPGAR